MRDSSNQGELSASALLHQGQPVLTTGKPLSEAGAAVVMLHGRGASAQGILSVADQLGQPDVAYLAPQAQGLTWYPNSFLAPIHRNEPALSSALRAVSDVVAHIRGAGMSADQIVLLGFSQGGCLALEYAARNPMRYGGVVAWSGGLIGTGDREGVRPPGDKTFDYSGDFDGTPVFLGCSDIDPHIPLMRVHTSAEVLRSLGAVVVDRVYEGMGHTINDDELHHARDIIARLLTESATS